MPKTSGDNGNFCGRGLELLRQEDLALTDTIVYTRRCVRPVYGNVDRSLVANVSSQLITNKTILNLTAACSSIETPPCEPLLLRVPHPYPKRQYNHLLFAVASSYDRLQDALPSFAHWLSGTGAQLVAVVADAHRPDSHFDLAALETAYRARGINATVIPPKHSAALPRKDASANTPPFSPAPVEQLHFLLIRDMLDLATPQTHWLGILDDDTFFPALHPLATALRRHDHSTPQWLGALTDNFISFREWGYMAYGGAGVFLSVPLAQQLAPHLETCVRTTTVPSGDGMLRDCVYAHSAAKLTLVPGLYQHDLRGDPSGFFESGRSPVLSLHHWKSWYRAPVAAMARVVGVCGGCFLQRWRFGGDTLFANGYSITVYREGLLQELDLDRVEGTWQDAGGEFDFVYGPFRPRLSEEDKKSYKIVAADGVAGKGGRFRQVYVHRAKRGEGTEEERARAWDEVVELVWEG